MTNQQYKRYLVAKDFLYALISLPKPRRYCRKILRIGSHKFSLIDEQCVGLERMKDFLERFNNPQETINFIHVAGTSGKGSVVAILQSILNKGGFRVGCFTSPHLTSPLERFQINGELMPADEFVRLVETVKPAVEAMYCRGRYGAPSYFETLWMIALLWFSQKRPDWVIVETGIGGALDSTNVIRPKLCLITDISLDHAELIGPTLSDIAANKAGIIKHQVPVLTSCQKSKLVAILQQKAEDSKTKLEKLGKDFRVNHIVSKERSVEFCYSDSKGKLACRLALAGKHQAHNAAIAIRAARILNINEKYIRQGLANVFWPARLEFVSENPRILLDGAHNYAKIKTLISYLKDFAPQRILVILAIMEKKDVRGIVRALSDVADKIFITRLNIVGRSMTEPLVIYNLCQKYKIDAEVVLWPEDALDRAIAEAGPNDLIVVTGSLFLVGKIRERWLSEEEIVANGSLKIK